MAWPEKTLNQNIKEITDRCRRLETRLTKFMEYQGFDVQSKKPQFQNKPGETAEINIYSLHTSIQDCLEAIPDGWDTEEQINVKIKGEFVFAIFTTE